MAQAHFFVPLQASGNNDFRQDNQNWAGLCKVEDWASPSIYASLATSPTPVMSARSQELLQKHDQTLTFPADQLLLFSWHTNLENLIIIQTAFSIWAEMETVYLS